MPGRCLLVLCLVFPVLFTPGVGAQSTRDPIALVKEGAAALDERRFGDALESFTAASAVLPRDPSLCFGAGMAAFMLGRNADAQEWFEKALKLNPRYRGASEWLGELHYRAGRLNEAIEVYEAALKHTPGANEIEARLGEWKKEASLQSRFYEARGAHFAVRFEGPGDELLARRAVDRLESSSIGGSARRSRRIRQTRSPSCSTRSSNSGTSRVCLHGPRRPMTGVSMCRCVERSNRPRSSIACSVTNSCTPSSSCSAAGMSRCGSTRDWPRTWSAVELRSRSRCWPRHGRRGQHCISCTAVSAGLSGEDAQVAYALSAKAVRRMMDLRSAAAVVTLLQDLARGVEFATAFHQNIGMRYEDFQAMIARE